MTHRPRRLRVSKTIREAVSETSLNLSHLIQPLFLLDGTNQKVAIETMPGQFRFSLDQLILEIEELLKLGIKSFVIFPVIHDKHKNVTASYALDENNFYYKAATIIKEKFPESYLISDVALDPYTTHGHDGLVCSETGKVLNDETIEVLVQMSLLQAKAGFDCIGPSDMMDGRVRRIREALDENNYKDVSIISYTAKYASAFYGPFRDALSSAPKKGDKKTYQMDYRNASEALHEALLDYEEGADILMVKPALSYLDIIYRLKQNFDIPIACYNVSGEYSMIKAASEKGMLNYNDIMVEVLTSMRRAGASLILTYMAKDYAQLIHGK